MKKLVATLFILSVTIRLNAQTETTLPALRGMHQSSYVNPAFMPEYKTSVGLPYFNNMIPINLNLSGFDLHTIASSFDDEKILDLNEFHEKLDGAMGYNYTFQQDIFYVRFPIKSFYIGINSTLKSSNTTLLSKEFIGLLAGGPAAPQTENTITDAININTTIWAETGVSLTKEIGKFSAGARFKYLQGIANVQTENVALSITNGANIPFPLSITTGGSVRMAGLPYLNDSIDGRVVTDDEKNLNIANMLKNKGWGVDLGVTYQINSKLNVHTSIVDLGSSINWKNSTAKYNLNNATATFDGFNYEQTNSSKQRRELIDSLVGLIGDASVTSDAYSTKLPTKYYVGADYDLNKNNRIGILLQGQEFFEKFYTAYTFSYLHRFGERWQVTTNYSLVDNSYSNVGFGTTLKLGAFQFFYLQDNVLALFNPGITRNVYLRLGFNLVWGAIEKKTP